MSDFIGMLLQAKIDPDAIDNIKIQIQNISKNIEPIKIDIKTDAKTSKDVANINKQVQDIVETSKGAKIDFKIDNAEIDKSKKIVDNVKNTITYVHDLTTAEKERLKVTTAANGEILKTQTTKDYKKEREELQKIIDFQEEYLANAKRFQSADILPKNITKDFEGLVKLIDVDATKDDLKMIENEYKKLLGWQKDIVDEMSKTPDGLKQLGEHYKDLEKEMNALYNEAVKFNKEFDKGQKDNQDLKERIELFKKAQELKIRSMEGRYGSLLDTNAISDYRNELNKLSTDIESPTRKFQGMRLELRNIEVEAQNNKRALDLANKSAMTLGEAFGTVARKLGIFSIVAMSYRKLFSEMKNGINFIQQLDKELTQVSIVTGKTRYETAELAQEYVRLGKEMKRTVTEISAVNTELVRQGLSLEESQKRLQTVMRLNAVSDVDTSPVETLKVITSSVNALKTEAETAADVILKASTISASSVGEIGDALTKVASSAQVTGLSIEQTTAMISTLEEVTQESSSSLGNSLKTLLARFNRVDEETGGFNKNLNDVQKAFESVGIKFTEADGSIRSFYDLMTDLNKVFPTLDKNTKNYVANMAAGIRQQNRFIALAENWDRVAVIQDELINSAGTLDKAYAQWLNSTEASANRAKLAMQELWMNTIDSDGIKSIYNLSTKLIELIDKFGVLNIVLFTVANSVLRKSDALGKLTAKTALAIPQIGLLKGATFALGASFDFATIKASLLWAALTLGASVVITAVISKIGKLINKQADLARSNEELAAVYKGNVSELHDKQSRLSQLGDEYDKIRNKIDNHIDLTDEEKTTLKEMTTLFPEIVKGYDSQGNAIIDTTISLNDLNQTLEEYIELEKRAFLKGSDDIFEETGKSIEKTQKNIEDLNRTIMSADNSIIKQQGYHVEDLHKGIDRLRQEYEYLVDTKGEDDKATQKALAALQEMEDVKARAVISLEEENRSLEENKQKRKEVLITTAELTEEYKKMPNVLKDVVREGIDGFDLLNTEGRQLIKQTEDLVKSLGSQDLNKAAAKYEELTRQYKLGNIEAKELDKSAQDLRNSILRIADIDDDIVTRLFPDSNNIKSISDDVMDLTTYFEVMGGVVNDAVDEYDLFNQALYELQTEGRLSRATLDSLLEIMPDLIEKTGLQEDALYDLLNASAANRRATIQDEIAKQKAIKEATLANIGNYKNEIEALKALNKARGAMALIDSGAVYSLDDAENARLQAEARANYERLRKGLKEIEAAEKKINALKAMDAWFDDVDKSYADKRAKSAKSGSSKSKKDEYKAEADRYAKINLELDKNNILLQRNKVFQELADDDLEKRINLMDTEIKLNKQRQQQYHALNQERRKEATELERSLAKQGFKFSGQGDNRMITNLNNIKGKTKEVEEQFKRYMQLQQTEIPQASQEWWNLQKTIENVTIEKTIKEFEQSDKRLKILKDTMSDLEYEFQLLDDKDLTGKADNIAKQMSIVEREVELAKQELEEMGEIGEDALQVVKDRQEELNKRVQEGTLSYKAMGKSLKDLRETARQEWVREQNALAQAQQDRINALDQIQEKIVAIIRKRGEEEKKALDKAHKEEMDSLNKRHNERKQKYKDELDEFKKMIQAKIDALDEQWNEEDYLEDLEKEREEAVRLQKEIDVLSLDDSLTARNKVIELREQLAKQNEKIAKMQQKRERDLLKKSLQDQLKDKEKDAKEREDIADNLYENEKKRLEEEYEINKEYLDRRYSDEQVYAEARKSIMRGEVEVAEGVFMDIYDAFVDFENKFGKGMGILGDIIRDDFTKELEKAQQAIRDLDYLASNRLRSYDSDYDPGDDAIGWRDPPRYSYGEVVPEKKYTIADYSDMYFEARDKGDWRTMEYANRQANILRGLGDIITAEKDIAAIKRKYGYAKGGETGATGWHWLDGSDNEPERVLSAQQTRDFNKLVYEDMPKVQSLLKSFEGADFQNIIKNAFSPKVAIPKVPNAATRQGVVYHIDKIFDISGTVTKDTIPLIRKEANGIEETLKSLNKGGTFRPVKTF